MKIVNLTGHPIHLGYTAETIQPERYRARVNSKYRQVATVLVEGPPRQLFPIVEVTEKGITHLPDPQEDTLYVVSGIVAAHAMRDDVVAPGRTQREGEGGRVTACHSFTRPRRKEV